MNHEEFKEMIEKDPEYMAAKEALRYKFALGDAIMRARFKHGWSQTELARRAGTKQANISHIESALANPTLDLIKKITDVLDLDVSFGPRVSETKTTVFLYQAAQNRPIPIPREWIQPLSRSITDQSQANWKVK